MTFVLNPHRHSAGGGAPASLSVTEFSRDKIIYDSGFAFGLDYAVVPVTIVTSPGLAVEVRAYSVDDGGATSTAWADLGTADGAGNLSGVITPVINRSGYRTEVRLKATPATTAQTGFKFYVGHVMAKWGQSEDHRQIETSYSNHAPETLLTLRQQVDRLKTTSNLGRTSKKPLKVVGVDTLPAGATLSSRSVQLAGTGTLSDWNLVDYELMPMSGSNWRVTQCRFEETGQNLIYANIRVKPGGRLRYDDCTFKGSSKPSSFSGAIVEEQNGAGTIYGKSIGRRCRFTDYPADAFKLLAGSIRWSLMKWKMNLGAIPTVWAAGTTFGLNELTYVGGGSGPVAHRSLIAGNIGNIPPAKGVDDANWQAVDPHVDAVTWLNAHEASCVEYCYIDFSELTVANGGIGMNNFIRWQNDDGVGSFAGGSRVRYCVMDRPDTTESPGVPLSVGSSFAGPVLLEGNWMTPRKSDGMYLLPVGTTVGARITWAGNTKMVGGAAVATPTNCVTGAFTQEVNDGMTQVVLHAHDMLTNGGANLGSGAAGVRHKFISDAAPHTASAMALANTFLGERPGEHICFAYQTLSGTSPSTAMTNNASRPWVDDQAVHDYITANGAKVGLVGSSWYASPIGWAGNYGRAWFEMVAGIKTDGSALNGTRTIMEGTGSSWNALHLWSDLYGPWDKSKFVIYGPHRFEENNDLLDATHDIGGATNTSQVNIQAIRASIKTMLTNPLASMFLPMPFDPVSYYNTAADLAHPDANSADGLARYARLGAHAFMQSAGLTNYAKPVFDQVTWEASGAYVDVGSSAGPIITTRTARSEAALPNTYTHWTDVAGWQLNGVPVDRAELVAGKVRIYPASGSLIFSDTIMFGEGGGTGSMKHPEDRTNGFWKNMPLVALGAYGLEGLPVSTLPPAAGLANTLPAPSFFTNPVGALAHFRDNVNWPNVISGADRVHQRITFFFDGKITSTGSNTYVCALEGGPNFTIEALNAGSFRLNVKDSANTSLLTNVGLGSFTFGARLQLTVTLDIGVTNACWTTLNGVTTQRPFTASANPICTASRRMRVLGSASGVAKMAGDIYEIAMWTDYVDGGGKPAVDTFLKANGRIMGNAAVANAHPWKQDAALFT